MTRLLMFFLSVLLFVHNSAYALSVGDTAGDFRLKDLSGRTVSLSDIKGKVKMIHFWALWCGSCKDEMPSLNRIYADLRDKGLEVATVSTDSSLNRLQEFVREKKITLPVLLDSDKKITTQVYGVIGIPVTFIIDSRGRVIEKVLGAREWTNPKMRQRIEGMLKRQD